MLNPFKKKENSFKLDEYSVPSLNESKNQGFSNNGNLSSSSLGEEMPSNISNSGLPESSNQYGVINNDIQTMNQANPIISGSNPINSGVGPISNNSQTINSNSDELLKVKLDNLDNKLSLLENKFLNLEQKIDLIYNLILNEVSEETKRKISMN